jgi:Fe-S-cluster-containing dehydrogenase component/DMSO reductase anchor subunit
MELPLLARARDGGVTFALTRRGASVLSPADLAKSHRPSSADDRVRRVALGARQGDGRMPARAPADGEQYRFHVDMGACIGCKCCVVACNEQNGNPASINWRRVGEIEGGWYPNATRSYLSMGCNHCLEPTCLRGCPVDAYTKDPATGIVHHSADACIGCQYCTWNCSYGVPQYNPERGVVGKCDMCHGRLSTGMEPACVSACPEGAIAIEIVDVAGWRRSLTADHPAAGIPVADGSQSSTRITMPEALPPNSRPHDLTHVAPGHPHWPLVVMTVLTQLSVGTFTIIWLLQLLGGATRLGAAATTSLAVGGLALAASTLHLGRPVYAYRALLMWRRSWISREVMFFSAFSAVAGVYAAALWLGVAGSALVGALTVVLGISGVTASACIYRVPSRPAWNTPYTVVQFALTGGVLGPLFTAALGVGDERWLAAASMSMAGALLVLLALRFLRLIASDGVELRGTARLLSTVLKGRLVLRGALVALGAIVLPLLTATTGTPGQAAFDFAQARDAGPYVSEVMSSPTEVGRYVAGAAFALALAGELLGRYLFFVSVVPRHMTAPYVASGEEAA